MVYIYLLFHKSVQSYKKKSIYANTMREKTSELYKKKKDCPLDNPISYLTLNLIPGKTRCKGTAFLHIYQIFLPKNMFYNIFFAFLQSQFSKTCPKLDKTGGNMALSALLMIQHYKCIKTEEDAFASSLRCGRDSNPRPHA